MTSHGWAAPGGPSYEELFQLVPEPYLVTDATGVVRGASEAARRLFDPELGGAHLRVEGIVQPEDRGELRRLMAEAAEAATGSASGEIHVIGRSRSWLAAVRCAADYDVSGHLAGYRWLLHDLSERERAEALREERHAKEAAELRDLAASRQRIDDAKSEFLRYASHELRGPLAILGGYLAMLLAGTFGQLPAEVQRIHRILSRKTSEMNDLVTELLDAARLQEGSFRLHLAQMDLAAVCRDVVRDWEGIGSDHEFVVRVGEQPLAVVADRSKVRTIATNLISNAAKYSTPGAPIACETYVDGERAVLAVTDRGPGIAPEEIPKLFTAFGRLERPEMAHIGGLGLGLYISRALAQAQGGDLDVVSVPGQGSTFRLHLPLAASPPT
jgi:signal transduction histidine kinase